MLFFRIVAVSCLLFCLAFLNACGGGGGAGGGTSTVTPSPTSKAAWTLMVYMDADNDLDPYASGDLAEMMAIGSTAQVNVIVQYDGYKSPAYRYKIEKGKLTKLVELGEPNMASDQTLKEFVTYSAANYPADRYALVLWNHGNGWKSGRAGKLTSSILADWDNNGINSASLDNALVAKAVSESGVSLDVLGVDACSMATIEAAYQFRNLAGYLVSSQELVQVKGWDYRDILTRLTAKPAMTAEELAVQAVASYRAQSEASGLTDQTMSAIKLSEVQAVVTAVDTMAKPLKNRISDSATPPLITYARNTVQEFDPYVDANTYVDLAQLGTLLEGASSPVATAVAKAVIAEYHGTSRSSAKGLSIVFFNLQKMYESSTRLKLSVYDSEYINYKGTRKNPVAFLDATEWDTFLDAYYSVQYPVMYPTMRNWVYLGAL